MITMRPPSAMIGETQHAGRVGQRRKREVDRAALERIAHQRQCRHRLDVAARQHDPLRLAGGAAGARDHREIVDRLALIVVVRKTGEPALERGREGQLGIEADDGAQLWQLCTHRLDHRREA
ncbi:hypothetical protein ABIF64_001172 [Bradyrhizobium japonicum]